MVPVVRKFIGNIQVQKDKLQQIDRLLDQNRRDLMNKNISSQMIARQNLITTRLLEAEKAEMEREFENKRESESANDFYSNPVKYFEYNNRSNNSLEYLNKNSHKLNNFYISKYKHHTNHFVKYHFEVLSYMFEVAIKQHYVRNMKVLSTTAFAVQIHIKKI